MSRKTFQDSCSSLQPMNGTGKKNVWILSNALFGFIHTLRKHAPWGILQHCTRFSLHTHTLFEYTANERFTSCETVLRCGHPFSPCVCLRVYLHTRVCVCVCTQVCVQSFCLNAIFHHLHFGCSFPPLLNAASGKKNKSIQKFKSWLLFLFRNHK